MFIDEYRYYSSIIIINSYRYYSSIYLASGMSTLADKYGDWFTHDGSPRAKIFARNHTRVTNMETLIQLMRYYYY